jgi:hypothetical protein
VLKTEDRHSKNQDVERARQQLQPLVATISGGHLA